MYRLLAKPLKLSEIKKLIPDFSEKMLIQELKTLCVARLANRKNFGEGRPKVAYELTPKGLKIIPLIAEMQKKKGK